MKPMKSMKSWNRNLVLLSVSVTTLLMAGCATTRVVKTKPGSGGEIMIQESFIGDARADAKKQMRSNCGRKKPVITEEGEAVIGSDTRSETRGGSKSEKFGLTTLASSSDSSTRQSTEWRVKYRCK